MPLIRALALLLLSGVAAAQMLRPNVFGPAWGWDSLTNTPLSTATRRVDYRIVADHAGQLDTIREYYIYKPGYGGGTGGTVHVWVESDDGTALHRPSGVQLGSAQDLTFTIGNNGSFDYSTFNISGITQGQVLHVLHRNSDGAPATNWVSLDLGSCVQCTTTYAQPAPSQPGLTELISDDGGATWMEIPTSVPIFSFAYHDGVKQGMPYYDSTALTPETAIRQSLTPVAAHSGEAFTLYVKPTATGVMTLTLQDAALNVIRAASATVQPTGAYQFVTFIVPPLTLAAATQYYLQLTATAAYTVRAIQNGGGNNFPWAAPYSGGCELFDGLSWSACVPGQNYDLPIGLVQGGGGLGGVAGMGGKSGVQ